MDVPKLYHFPTENDSFTMPGFGTFELQRYITEQLRLEDGTNVFTKGIQNMCLVDMEHVLPLLKPECNETDEDMVIKAAQMLTFNRLANRICEECGDKSNIKQLSLCTACCTSWYCGQTCQLKHWSTTHKHRCRQMDGPADTKYNQPVIAKVKPVN